MVTAKIFVNGIAITNSEVVYYTAPLKTRGIIKNAVFTNDNTTPITVSINIVSTEESASYENRIVKNKTIPGNGSWICSALMNQILEPGIKIIMVASITNKIGCNISGFEIT